MTSTLILHWDSSLIHCRGPQGSTVRDPSPLILTPKPSTHTDPTVQPSPKPHPLGSGHSLGLSFLKPHPSPAPYLSSTSILIKFLTSFSASSFHPDLLRGSDDKFSLHVHEPNWMRFLNHSLSRSGCCRNSLCPPTGLCAMNMHLPTEDRMVPEPHGNSLVPSQPSTPRI